MNDSRSLLRAAGWVIAVSCLGAAVGCGRQPRSGSPGAPAPSAPLSASASSRASASAPPPPLPRSAPQTLLTLDATAYGVRVALDEEAAYLFTADAAHRLVVGQAPQRMPLDLGLGPVLTQTSIVFWSKGSIFAAPKRGGPARALGTAPHQPQFLVSSGDRFAWLDRSEDGRFTIQTLDGKRARIVHAPAGPIATMTMLHDWVFFVEQVAPSSWRLGGVSLDGGAPAFTAARSGRTPATLAAASDLFFYDGPTRSVRRLSPDLQEEVTLAKDCVCSPIAVADRILCARVGGLFELQLDDPRPRALVERPRGAVTALAAGPDRVVWVTDAGRGQLAVEQLPLAPLGPTTPRPPP